MHVSLFFVMAGLVPAIDVFYCLNDAKTWMPGTRSGMTTGYEKNAIFSAWLMRRIGASGSGTDASGLRTIPFAISVEPSESWSDG
jgi:hypothetical protein